MRYLKYAVFFFFAFFIFYFLKNNYRRLISLSERKFLLERVVSIEFNNSLNEFYFKNNIHPVFKSSSELLNYLILPQDTDSAKTLKIFEFCSEHFHFDLPFIQDTTLHSPIVFLNTYGYGYCDDAAAFFVNLCKQAGLDACVISFDGHVAAQVYFNNGWKFFDPSIGKYLKDKNCRILSLSDLYENPISIKNLYEGYIGKKSLFNAVSKQPNNECNNWYDTKQFYIKPNFFSVQKGKMNLYAYRDKINMHLFSEDKSYKSGKGVLIFYPKNGKSINIQTQFRYITITIYFRNMFNKGMSFLLNKNRNVVLDNPYFSKIISYDFIENHDFTVSTIDLESYALNDVDSITVEFIFNADYLLNDNNLPCLVDSEGKVLKNVRIFSMEK